MFTKIVILKKDIFLGYNIQIEVIQIVEVKRKTVITVPESRNYTKAIKSAKAELKGIGVNWINLKTTVLETELKSLDGAVVEFC